LKGGPVINSPSLGSVRALGYLVTIFVLMLCGTMVLLNYIFFITMSVPVFGAFHREPKFRWRIFSTLTVAVACGFLLIQFQRQGVAGLVFYSASDPFGWIVPQVNFTSFLAVALVFLPLSFACALDRIRAQRRRKGHASSQPVTPVSRPG
jgi:hypothetical protein